jgi:ribonuclease HII
LKKAEEKEIEFSLAERSHHHIDENGLAASLKSAFVEVFKNLWAEDSYIICDGKLSFVGFGIDNFSIESMIKADTKIPQVMAASIIGKCFRDEKVKEIAKEFPEFGWDKNCGYFSESHLEALKKFGPTKFHRMTFVPMKNMVKK